MDALALLCTLHADGPATVRLLRRAGIATLADLERSGADRLADVLGASPGFARRLQREGRLVEARLGEIPLDVEEAVALDRLGTPPRAAPEPAPEPEREPARAPSTLEADLAARSELRSMKIAPRALAWPRAPERAQEQVEPRTAAGADRPLAEGALPGLDALLCERLLARGIRTLGQLASAPGLPLARAIGLPYARLCQLQVLARAVQRETAEPRAAALAPPVPLSAREEPIYVLRPAPRAAPARDSIPELPRPAEPEFRPADLEAGVGGPFA